MTEADRVNFNAILISVYDLFGKQSNDKTIALYFDILKPYDFSNVKNAFSSCLASVKFFPKPAEIIENIQGKEDDIVDFAFEDAKRMAKELCFYSSVKMKDRILMQVIRDFGGLQEWCEAVAEDKNKLYFEFKRMYRRYLSLWKCGEWKPEIESLTGYSETLARQNSCGGTAKLLLWDKCKVAEKIVATDKNLLPGSKQEFKSLPDGGIMKLLENIQVGGRV